MERFRDGLHPLGIRERVLLESINELLKNKFLKFREDGKRVQEDDHERILGNTLGTVMNYSSMYQPSKGKRKPNTRTKEGNASAGNILLENLREMVQQTPIGERSTISFVTRLFLEIEDELYRYFRSVNMEWVGKIFLI